MSLRSLYGQIQVSPKPLISAWEKAMKQFLMAIAAVAVFGTCFSSTADAARICGRGWGRCAPVYRTYRCAPVYHGWGYRHCGACYTTCGYSTCCYSACSTCSTCNTVPVTYSTPVVTCSTCAPVVYSTPVSYTYAPVAYNTCYTPAYYTSYYAPVRYYGYTSYSYYGCGSYSYGYSCGYRPFRPWGFRRGYCF